MLPVKKKEEEEEEEHGWANTEVTGERGRKR